MFRRLIGVSRVGPKLALGMLSHLEVSDIAAAILTENAAALSRVPGLGKKIVGICLVGTPEAVATFGKLRPIIRRRLAANCAPAKLDAFLNVRLFEK